MDLPDTDNLLTQPTRARLFAALKRLRRAATTEDLAEQVGLHVNGVRRQLERMQEGGLLERAQENPGRGRPRDEWSIAVAASPSGERPVAYADLTAWLIRAIPTDPAGLRQVQEEGRRIGRELAPDATTDVALSESVSHVLTSLGFQPEIETGQEGVLCCRLGNCPYRDSARENPEVVCTLHKGITEGLLDELDPAARMVHFEPHDPSRAGCTVEIVPGDSGSR